MVRQCVAYENALQGGDKLRRRFKTLSDLVRLLLLAAVSLLADMSAPFP